LTAQLDFMSASVALILAALVSPYALIEGELWLAGTCAFCAVVLLIATATSVAWIDS